MEVINDLYYINVYEKGALLGIIGATMGIRLRAAAIRRCRAEKERSPGHTAADPAEEARWDVVEVPWQRGQEFAYEQMGLFSRYRAGIGRLVRGIYSLGEADGVLLMGALVERYGAQGAFLLRA